MLQNEPTNMPQGFTNKKFIMKVMIFHECK